MKSVMLPQLPKSTVLFRCPGCSNIVPYNQGNSDAPQQQWMGISKFWSCSDKCVRLTYSIVCILQPKEGTSLWYAKLTFDMAPILYAYNSSSAIGICAQPVDLCMPLYWCFEYHKYYKNVKPQWLCRVVSFDQESSINLGLTPCLSLMGEIASQDTRVIDHM